MATQVCGIYIGGEHVSALNLRPVKKSWAIVGGASQLLESDQPDVLSATLKSVLRAVKLKDAELEVALPRRQGLLREVLLPATDAAELAQMAQFEAERHIPFNADRHSTGYHILSQKGVEGSEVLLAAIDRPYIERCLNAVVSTGVKLGGITLSSLGLFNAIQFARREWIKDKTVLVASLGLEALDIAILSKGRLIYGRAADLGLRSVLEDWAGKHAKPGETRLGVDRLLLASHMIDCDNPAAEADTEEAAALRAWIDGINRQMSLTHDYARRNMKAPPIDAILLTGEGSVLRNITTCVGEALRTEVQTINPVDGLAGAGEQKFPFGGLEFVVPFGCAIAGAMKGSYRLDLTPVAHYRRVARQRLMRRLVTTSVLAIGAVSLATASYYKLQDINAKTYAAYSEVNDLMRPQINALNEMKLKTRIIKSFTEDPNAALIVLNTVALSRTIPGRVSISSIQYTKYKEISIEGNAQTTEDFNDFIQDLRLTNHFTDVLQEQFDPDTNNPIGKPIYSFKLTCPLKQPPAAAKKEKAL